MLKRSLPDLFTLANLLFGCIGIMLVLKGEPVLACYTILISGVFDFFDGMIARALKINNPHGKDLDSLADVVSFGVLPGFLAMSLINGSDDAIFDKIWLMGFETTDGLSLLSYVAFLIPVLSAYRLAKFNHDTRQTDSFIGLPTPANALFWCGLVVGIDSGIWWLIATPVFIVFLSVFFSFLLLAPLPMFSFKMKNFGWADNRLRYIFLLCCLPVLIMLQVAGLAAIVVLFILFSIIQQLGSKNKSESV
jgi:CDP-diacylglycerol--serine O-phosphatidyltransferase